MALTPRAEELKPKVRRIIEEGKTLLEQELPFAPELIKRTFTVYSTDHILLVLGPVISDLLSTVAPGVKLRFLPSASDDWKALREGAADLSICLPGHFPNEFLTRRLFTDRFVCAVSANHPSIGHSLSLEEYLKLEHIVVSPLGYTSAVDASLAHSGYSRIIRTTVPYFLTGLHMLTHSDAILTVSERAALALKDRFNLKILPSPIAFPDYSLHLLWHPRVDSDPENRWLREQFIRAAEETEPK